MPLNPNSYDSLFISEQTLKDNSVINDNVDMHILTPIIQLVNDTMEGLLGTALFVQLQNSITASAVTTDELFLLQAYVQPCMIWGIMKEAPTYMTYKHAGKGIEKMSSDNSQPAGKDELEMLADKAESKYGFYADRLIRYLTANQSKYPAYFNGIQNIDDKFPRRTGYRSRIALGNARSNNDYCNYIRYR